MSIQTALRRGTRAWFISKIFSGLGRRYKIKPRPRGGLRRVPPSGLALGKGRDEDLEHPLLTVGGASGVPGPGDAESGEGGPVFLVESVGAGRSREGDVDALHTHDSSLRTELSDPFLGSCS